MEGAVLRLRPKLMTVSTVVLGLLPILWSTATGSEVMKPSPRRSSAAWSAPSSTSSS